MALTGRKQAFADALLAGKTKTEAAVAAGLSAKTAPQAGSRLAKDKDVVAYMAKHGGSPAVRGRGLTLPNGQKAPEAGPDWPFGTAPPPAAPPVSPPAVDRVLTAREYLSQVVNSMGLDEKVRIDAAKKLIEFEEAKPAPMGKKEARAAAAKGVAGGRFSSSPVPLALVKR